MNNLMKQHVKIQPDVLFQIVNGETVLLNLKNEMYFGLDKTGTRFWQLLQVNSDLLTIFNAMLVEYEVDAEQLKTDLDMLIEQMVEAGLIEIVNSV